jgi:hypothetical protein
MGWDLGLNGLHPGATWDTIWAKMGCALGLNGLRLRAKWDGA